ncbi:MAG TPA: hypothetical protein PLQ00_10725, partial [Thermoguttaceae bacterium]|nr:hypothetical protein [Thermoguttaceae bacterium]
EACMESYFVMEAVSEALEAAWREGETANELFQAVRALGVAIDDFDKALQERDTLALLSTVVELPLLENWRSQLAGVHKECPPWWLDGTLEAVDQEITEICRRTLPAGQTWRRLVAGAAGPTAQPAAPPTRPEIGLPEETEMPRPITRPRRPYRYVAAEIFQIQPFYAAAADTPIKLPPIKTFLQWRSPDGRFQARLEIPSEASPEAMLVMQFLTPQEELASELGGQPVWLGGVEAYIEPAGVARFPLQRLKEQLGKPEAELILQVGPDRTEWPAAEQT